MGVYTNIINKIESEGLDNAVMRFNCGGVEFFSFFSDVQETVKTVPSIVDDLSDMGFDVDLVTKDGTAVSRFLTRVENCDGDYLSGVWTILRRFRRCTSLERPIRLMSDSFVNRVRRELKEANAKSNRDKHDKRQVKDKDGAASVKLDYNITLDEYKSRQLRCYTNKLKHGFNVTDFQKEARFILKELSELMDAIEHNDVENLIEELGDIVIFCYGIAEMAHKDLDTQVFKKMAINESRVYTRNEHGDFVRQDN